MKNKITSNITTYHFEEESDDSRNGTEMIFLPNRKKMMMKLMRLQLKQFMRSKLMKKLNNLQVIFFLNLQLNRKEISFKLVTKFLT